jgi:hypothetical protein
MDARSLETPTLGLSARIVPAAVLAVPGLGGEKALAAQPSRQRSNYSSMLSTVVPAPADQRADDHLAEDHLADDHRADDQRADDHLADDQRADV